MIDCPAANAIVPLPMTVRIASAEATATRRLRRCPRARTSPAARPCAAREPSSASERSWRAMGSISSGMAVLLVGVSKQRHERNPAAGQARLDGSGGCTGLSSDLGHRAATQVIEHDGAPLVGRQLPECGHERRVVDVGSGRDLRIAPCTVGRAQRQSRSPPSTDGQTPPSVPTPPVTAPAPGGGGAPTRARTPPACSPALPRSCRTSRTPAPPPWRRILRRTRRRRRHPLRPTSARPVTPVLRASHGNGCRVRDQRSCIRVAGATAMHDRPVAAGQLAAQPSSGSR